MCAEKLRAALRRVVAPHALFSRAHGTWCAQPASQERAPSGTSIWRSSGDAVTPWSATFSGDCDADQTFGANGADDFSDRVVHDAALCGFCRACTTRWL